ncbi:non-specific lipid-transfer protein Cor a 8 [Medicago truncatula]|uniref:Non-specific lipid-transfer protein n=1 Tax=Medicago truncatula TaxID=3880 RepID=G7KX45_MEDTR|nr:non-specific lipid-transfer protein Cor a 8-like [Medicago truncatula]AES79805.1 Lipid transfer protein [Medicago truncatula]
MATSMLVKITCLSVICLVLAIPLANAAIACNDLLETLYPCVEFITSPGFSDPSSPCCDGIKRINDEAITTLDRQNVCKCLKPVVPVLPGLNPDNFATLPDKCGVNLLFSISPHMNCNKIN